MKALTLSVVLLSGLALPLSVLADGPAMRAGTVWSLGQDGRVLNNIGRWETQGGTGRLWYTGTNRFIEVFLSTPLARSNGINSYRYVSIDTHAQVNNPGIWTREGIGELVLDFNTMNNGYVNGAIRQTAQIEEYVDSSATIPDVTPWQPIRFTPE